MTESLTIRPSSLTPSDPGLWAIRIGLVVFVILLSSLPATAHAQTVDHTTIVTSIMTWLTGPFGKISIVAIIAVCAFWIAFGHHPMAYIIWFAIAFGAVLSLVLWREMS